MANFDLKPCPFCGKSARIRNFGERYRVVCSSCGARGEAVCIKRWHSTKYIAQNQAAALWNSRSAARAATISEMEPLKDRDAALEELWAKFADVPMNPETEKLEAAFLHFPAGTNRMEVWRWFDDRHSKGVLFLLYGVQADGRRCEAVWGTRNQNDIEDVQSYIEQFSDADLQSKYHVDRDTICKLIPAAAAKMRKFIDNDDSWTFHRDSAIERTVKDYLKGEIQL